MKNKRYFIVSFLMIAIVMIIYLLYENISLSQQIDKQDIFIRNLLVKDSISSSLLPIEDQDSMFIVTYVTDDVGNKLSYADLDSIRNEYKYKYEIADMVLVRAKRLYQFDYSVKDSANMIIFKFWKKQFLESKNDKNSRK